MQVSAGLCRAIPKSTNLTSTASTTSGDSLCVYITSQLATSPSATAHVY